MENLVTPSPDFWRGRRVLLTGHTGFKGSWCALWLQELGAYVQGLALEPATVPDLWSRAGRPGGGSASLGDIRDAKAVNAVMNSFKPEIVIHMAAQALVQDGYRDPVATYQTNIMGLVHVFEAARRSPGLRAFVNVTSDKCYENQEQLWAYRETEPMGGSDPYSASKGCAELITSSYRRSFFCSPEGPQLGSGRAGNVIGGGDWASNRLLPDCVRAFEAGEVVMVRNPLARRPWQHVLEPVCGYLILAQALFERGLTVAEGWNFGPSDDEAWHVGRVVDRFSEIWGAGASWQKDDAVWAKEAMVLRVDALKARSRLGWRPRLSMDQTLSWTAEWYKNVGQGRSELEMTLEQIRRYETVAA